jgi:transcriptional regulator of arginine metabolism
LDDLRTFPKRERHRLVVSLIARKRIGTQHELMSSLASAGCRVTQATVSRDIAELGLEKVHDALGRPRYVQPQDADSDAPREALAAVLSQFGRRATAAENIVVVVAELGAAPAIARALDRVRDERVVGTLAGDDTCLVISHTAASAKQLARELSGLIG